MLLALIYLLFFLSGGAALIYQLVWVRSLTLIFGGSHLAVTAVLSTFMAGLAIGGYVVGRRVDRTASPLRLYGLLELGIAASALLVAGLMKVYPSVYVVLAHGRDDATLYLTAVRMVFAAVALIVPTILMGGTLPVLSRFVSGRPENLRSHLSLLYGLNTLGAVVGALLAGFVLLRLYSVSTTLYIAVATNAAIGLVSLLLQRKVETSWQSAPAGTADAPIASADVMDSQASGIDFASARLVLWGIGISGFCALGYEVLWTRVLTIAVGASVYGFTVMLAAFLTGIALGSKAYGLVAKLSRGRLRSAYSLVVVFGLTQVAIGFLALLVTVYLRDIPANAVRLQSYFAGEGPLSFEGRVWANLALAFSYMLVPALFMGAAFPIAGDIVARQRQGIGRAVGNVLAANTIGAILGSAVSGLFLARFFGIERALQMLVAVNLGLGVFVIASRMKRRWIPAGVTIATLLILGFLAVNTEALRVWDQKYFAVFRNNQPEAFRTPEMVKEAVENTDVLFYGEGSESIISVIRVKGGEQAFVTNGRVEASTDLREQQTQMTLGHLPMLLAANPKDVLVVGLGSGMTTGATIVHPSVERVTLVEIETQALGAARTFGDYNHRVLDDPKLRVVVNDGRNFLLTTSQTFDVITADPIHPWFRGAGYLYASEYFAQAAAHLRPGGVIAQWLPIYELTPQDLASVVRTFQAHFPNAMMWLTHYDAVMVGSATPFRIDPAEIQRRMAVPAVAADLQRVTMASAPDLLSYFVMGSEGMKRFGEKGQINTDDRLYLEFSAPFSIARAGLMAENVRAIGAHRESILPYLAQPLHPLARDEQAEKWAFQLTAGKLGDSALALFLGGGAGDPAFLSQLRQLNFEYPSYAPGRFLGAEYQAVMAMEPRLLQQASFPLMDEAGDITEFEMSVVLVPVSRTRASIMFVDNRARAVYGQRYLDDFDREGLADRLASDVMTAIRGVYHEQTQVARQQSRALPHTAQTLQKFRAVIGSKVQSGTPTS